MLTGASGSRRGFGSVKDGNLQARWEDWMAFMILFIG
jgi:hypothetical protein